MQVQFVDIIPRADSVKAGSLYVSLKYNMTTHRCACGCGSIVPLPISPTDWSLAYDGEHISLSPSVGNGALACRSHYFIRDSQIVWLPKMSEAQTQSQTETDRAMLEKHAEQQATSRGFIGRLIERSRAFLGKFIRRL